MTVYRWAALFGLLAAVLIVAGVLISGDTPDGDAPDEEWTQYIDEDQNAVLIRAYLFVAAAIALVAFFSFGIEPRLGREASADRALAGLARGATLLGAGALVFAGLIGAAVGAASSFADVAPDPAIARLFDNLLYGGLLVGAAPSLGVLMVVVAIQSSRKRAFPQWILWLSVVAAVGMAASLIFLPLILLPIWLVAVSAFLFRESDPAAA